LILQYRVSLVLAGSSDRARKEDMWAERLTFRQLFAYHLCMDQAKENGAVLIAASIVAAIRLRGQEIKPSPKLNAVVYDSILLARTILAHLEMRGD
jgi:hypothetical protein